MTQNLEFHPVADLFPLLQSEAFQKLVADIQNNGLLEPILVDAERRIIDGRNRYLACLEAGVQPRLTEWQGEHLDLWWPAARAGPQFEPPPVASERVPAGLSCSQAAKLWTAQGLDSAANLHRKIRRPHLARKPDAR